MKMKDDYNLMMLATVGGVDITTFNSNNILGIEKLNNKKEVKDFSGLTLVDVFKGIGATTLNNNKFEYAGYRFTVKDDKFYNITYKGGGVGVERLAAHLMTINKYMESVNNAKELLFIDNDLIESSNSWLEKLNNKAGSVKEATEEERKAKYMALTEEVNNISLDTVLTEIGANPNEDGQAGKWKVLDTGDNIAVTGQRWYSWKSQEGGVGAISLMAYHLACLNNNSYGSGEDEKKELWKAGRSKLLSIFGYESLEDYAYVGTSQNFKVPYCPPIELESKIGLVRDYLHKGRGLPLWIIDKHIENKTLYAGHPSDWVRVPRNKDERNSVPDDRVWATFTSGSKTASEMRAVDRTDEMAKLLAAGSDKDFAGFIVKGEKKELERVIVATESAIDALAYCSFFPGKSAVSCMGVTHNLAIKMARQAFDNNYGFSLNFDNDRAGNEAAVRFRKGLIAVLGEDVLNESDKEYSEDQWDRLLNEEGLKAYSELIKENKISYYELGVACLEESVKQDKVFYLDADDTDIGMDIVRIFSGAIKRKFGSNYVNNLIKENKIKYIDLTPKYERLNNIEVEVDNVIKKLSSVNPYYLVIDASDDSHKNQKNFIDLFYKKAKGNLQDWENSGKIVYGKPAVIAKDWNDFLKYKMKNDVDFEKKIQDDEIKYGIGISKVKPLSFKGFT